MLISSRRSILCVGDLHLGYELALRESGFNLPTQVDHILNALLDIEDGDHLLILGDLKHTIPYTSRSERLDLSYFFSSLEERFSSITIVAGNHDGGLRRSIPEEIELISSRGTRIGSVGLVHGHSWPSDEVMRASSTLLWAHIHPSVRMYDRLGMSISLKCWLRGPTARECARKGYSSVRVGESIVMPAFNHLLVGTPINETMDNNLSPLTRSGFVPLERQHAYTLEGVDLGDLSALSFRGKKRRST